MRQTFLRKAPEIRSRILIALVFLLPLFFLRGAYDIFNVPKLWLLMVAVLVVGAVRVAELLQSSDRAGVGSMVVPAAAVGTALSIGTLLSPYRVWSLIGDHSRFTGLVPYLTVILLGILIADAFRAQTAPLAWALVGSAAVAGAYAVVQIAGLDPLEWSTHAGATVTIGNTNFAGAFFAICLPVAVGLAVVEPDRRILAAGAAALILAGWIAARSEVAWGAGIAGLLVLGGIVVSAQSPPARLIGFLAAAGIAVAGIAIVVVAMTPQPPAFIPLTIERRAEWWGASLRMAADSPLVGRGPNSFAIEHTQYRDIDDVLAVSFDVTDDPHSVPLAFLTAAGLFGVAGFVVMGGWVVFTVMRVQPDQVLGAAFGAAACAYLVQALLSVDVVTLRFTGWSVMGGMAGALAPPLVARAKGPPGKKKKKMKSKPAAEPLDAVPAIVGIVVVAVFGFGWATAFLSADLSFRRGLALAASGTPGARETLRSAITFRKGNYTYRANYGNLVGGNAVREGLSEDGDRDLAQDLMEEAEDAFGFIDHLPHSNSVVVYARLMRAWAEVEPAAEEKALDLYQRAAELDPNNFLILEEAAGVAETFGHEELSREFAVEAARLRRSAQN